MLAAALIFAVLDGLIKTMGPAFRVWDIAFIRWGGSLALLIIIFGRQGELFKTDNLKLMIIRSITGCITFFFINRCHSQHTAVNCDGPVFYLSGFCRPVLHLYIW